MAMDLGDAKLIIRVDDRAFNAKLAGIGKNTEALGKRFRTMGLVMVAAGAAIAGALALMVKSAANFEGKMREVNSMLGQSEAAFQGLSDEVLEVSAEVGKSSSELAAALYQIVSAGVDAANSITFLGVAARAAVAGITDVATAADALTTVINAFKLSVTDAEKVADVLFTTVKGGKTTFAELAAALFNVAPIASVAGIQFEEVAAAIATVTKQGVPTTIATTQLRAAIQAIIKPTADMTRALEKVGYASGEAMLKEQGFAGSLNLLREVSGGSLDALGKMFGSIEALGAVLSLTGDNAKTFSDDLVESFGAAGAMTEAYDEINKGANRQFEIMLNNLKLIGIEMGRELLPILTDFLNNHIMPIITKLKEWITENEGLAKTLLVIAGFLIAGGALLLGLSLVSKAIIAINSALVIMHSLSGPTGWAMLAAGIGIAAASFSAIKALTATIPEPITLTPEAHAAIQKGLREGTITPEMLPASYRASLYSPLPDMQYGGTVPGLIGAPVPIIAHGGEQFAGVGKSLSPVNIYIGSFMGDDASLRAFSKTVKEVMGQDSRRTSFPSINRLEYFPGSSAP